MAAKQQRQQVPRRSPGRPSPDNAAEIDELLLDVALAEFIEHGYGGASMSRIVRNARISKTTLYARFASKADIFKAIVDRQINQQSPGELLVDVSGALSLEQGLKNFALHMLEASLSGDMLEINRLMLAESRRFPELAESASRRTRLGVERIAAFICASDAAAGASEQLATEAAEVFIYAIRGRYVEIAAFAEIPPIATFEPWLDSLIAILCRRLENA